jgi:hypothetical protein
MKLKNHGFSLVELLAILLITTIIIQPLISSLVGNIEVNNRAQLRRSALGIAEGTVYGLDKIDFLDFRTQLDVANTSDFYIKYDANDCPLLSETKDQNLCTYIFNQSWGEDTYNINEFKVYMFNFALTSAQHSSIYGNLSIEEDARNLIQFDLNILEEVDQTDIPELIRVVVWIDYYDDPDASVVLTGVIFDD